MSLTPEEIAIKVATESLYETESVVRWQHPALIEDITDAIREAVAEEREACAVIARSNNSCETESDIQNVGQSAYDPRRSEKASPESTDEAESKR